MSKFNLLLILCSTIAYGQIVNIPDINFKNALIGNSAINTNADTEIQLSEAINVQNIDVSNMGIQDLTGIEAFTNVVFLNVSHNTLSSIDLSQNVDLQVLGLNNNFLTTLDVSINTNLVGLNITENSFSGQFTITNHPSIQNFTSINNHGITEFIISDNSQLLTVVISNSNQLTTASLLNNSNLFSAQIDFSQMSNLTIQNCNALTDLYITDNNFTSLDLSTLTTLKNINISNNQLISLDFSNNPNLEAMSCSNNNLTSLDLRNGNNTNISFYNSLNNSNLTCVLVDDANYSNANWTLKDAYTNFGQTLAQCNTLSNQEFNVLDKISFYPNPTNSILNISIKEDIQNVEIYNLLGSKVMEHKSKSINVSTLENGIYLLKVITKEGVFTAKRFIKN